MVSVVCCNSDKESNKPTPKPVFKFFHDTVYVAKRDTVWLNENKFIVMELQMDTITRRIHTDTNYFHTMDKDRVSGTWIICN